MTPEPSTHTHISVQDASNYFKGLLILIGRDRKISKPECILMNRIGKALGFEKEFCNNAVQDILDNSYIVDTLPEFSSQDIAKKFILDGLTIALADGSLHLLEEEWLESTAVNYHLDDVWFQQEKERALNRTALPEQLEAETIVVDYSKRE
jgi:hypothetical protein